MNQVEFAQLLGVSQSAYKNYERDAAFPPITLLLELKQRFGISTGWIIEGIGERDPGVAETRAITAARQVDRYLLKRRRPATNETKYALIGLYCKFLQENEVPNEQNAELILKGLDDED
jgi:transcriptional regulator with XRE-family HTH domain